MRARKVYIIRSAMCRQEINYFDIWYIYGVYTSRNIVSKELEQSFKINKGYDLITDEFNKEMRTYSCFSTDGHPCYVRTIVETYKLNNGW